MYYQRLHIYSWRRNSFISRLRLLRRILHAGNVVRQSGANGNFSWFLNLVVLRVRQLDNFTFWVTNLANILALLFLAFYLQVDKDPQGYVLTGVLISMTIAGWISNRKSLTA